MKKIGSQKGDAPKTPTLRQFIKAGNEVVTNNYVNRIFLPGDYHQITLVVSTGFWVLVGESNPLYGDLLGLFDSLDAESICLIIQVTDVERCVWELYDKEDANTTWKKESWGFVSEKIAPKKTPRSKKNQTRELEF